MDGCARRKALSKGFRPLSANPLPNSASHLAELPGRARCADVLTRLRAETRHVHTRLEKRFDAVAILREPGGRAEFLARFWRLHQGLDSPIALWVADVAGLQFERRRRAPALTAALASLGIPIPSTPAVPPCLYSRAEALGALYVLEGSTMGGRVILRQLAAICLDRGGLDFLDPYGADSGRMWKAFLDVLELEAGGDEAAMAEAVRGARNGFSWAEACLCGTPEAA